MRLTNLTIMHAVVMIATLGCLTALGIARVIEGGALTAILAGIAGTVFGAAASQSAANGTARTVVDAAIERGAEIELTARRQARADEGR